MKVFNSNYGGFKRRKAEREKQVAEQAERDAKRASEPQPSLAQTQAILAGVIVMGAQQDADMAKKLQERRRINGGW